MEILVNDELFEFAHAHGMEFSIYEYEDCWKYSIDDWNAEGEVHGVIKGSRYREGYTREKLFAEVLTVMQIMAVKKG
jgi:hypothetical protein